MEIWSAITEETNREQGLLFKLKKYKPYDSYKSGSAMPENKRFNDTKKIAITYLEIKTSLFTYA